MGLLLCLAERPGEVVSIDELLDKVWTDVAVSPDSVYQAVASLRRLLRDDPKRPAYIATVPRLGYRMVATVGSWEDEPLRISGNQSTALAATDSPARTSRHRTVFLVTVGAVLCLVAVAGFLLRNKAELRDHSAVIASHPDASIAVLPFVDLTEGMKEEEFADGMAEEIIDRLSKMHGLHVPSATSSFYFKNKQIPVAEIAKTLGVTYLLDGSVRKSGTRLRVAARLVRADDGYVIWSESYDRPLGDLLMVQDDIAGEVTKALRTYIELNPGR